MANFTTISSLDFGGIAAGLQSSLGKSSAFAQAARSINLGIAEKTTVVSVSADDVSGFVAEGAQKPAFEGVTGVKVENSKQAYIFVTTNELDEVVGEELRTQLYNDAPRIFGRGYDRAIAGEISAPNANFSTLADAPEVDLTENSWANLNNALGDLGEATSLVLSNKLYRRLTGLTTTTGAPLLGNDGSIAGLPVYTFNGSTAVGFVGDFEGASVSSVTSNPLVRMSDSATIETTTGGTVNLFQDNKVAWLYEMYFAFGARDVASNFRKLTWDTTPPVEG